MPFDFDTVSVPFRMQPGLRRLAAGAPQLTPLAPGDAALTEKLVVLSNFATQALLSAPGFDAAPAVRALAQHAATEHSQAFAVQDNGDATALQLGWSLRADVVEGHGPAAIGDCLRALPAAWRLTGLLCLAFAEDFAVIDGNNGHIPWLAVCLPSHWSPADKVGRHFAAVHAPVADNQTLVTASDHLARLVTGDERWERFVWTITPQARLDNHPERMAKPPWPDAAGVEDLAADAFLRTERQTFIPLPAQRQAIFTIHVEVQPLRDAVATAAQARQLHDALASMSANVLAYRGLAAARGRLLAWLAGRGAAASEPMP
jgi:dimethylamine monooxygenase subunit A